MSQKSFPKVRLGPEPERACPAMRTRQSVPVRKAINWLKDSFDARRYPWFSPHFIHPDEFLASYQDGLVVPLFDQMAGDI